jgi:hypothetical protein
MSGITIPLNGNPISKGYAVTTGTVAAYTCNVKKAVLQSLNICNVDGSAGADLTLSWYDLSTTTAFPIYSTDAVANDTREPLTEFNLFMDQGDEIRVTASANGDLVIVLSIVEILGPWGG